jgi:hypothetical protein
MTIEKFIGRGLAFCLNPLAAWRVLPGRGRALVIVAYACAGYVTGLTALLLW